MPPFSSSLSPPPNSGATPVSVAEVQTRTWKCGTLVYTSAALVGVFVFLLLGDFSLSMRDRSVGPLSSWYLKKLGISNTLFAILLGSFPSLLAMILGPIMSVKSDHHRGPRGRRIPFLLFSTPFAAAAIIGMGLTPLIAGRLHQTFPQQNESTVALVCFSVFLAIFELITTAFGGIFGGLINDVVPHALMGRFYGLFRAVSLIDGIIFNYWLFGKVETRFTVIMLAIGVFYGVSFYWVCRKVREGEYPPPPAVQPSARPLAGVSTYFRECFGRPYYVGLFIMATVATLVFMPVNAFMIPYAMSLNMNMDRYGKCIALSFGISLVLAFPLGWLADLFHPLRLSIVFLLGYAVVTAWGSLSARSADTFAVALVAHSVLSGCYFTVSASLGARLYPRVRFAQFASAAGIVASLGSIIFTPLMGKIIDLSGNAYHYTFTAGCVVAVVALAVSCGVYWQFVKLGGPRNYVPPE